MSENAPFYDTDKNKQRGIDLRSNLGRVLNGDDFFCNVSNNMNTWLWTIVSWMKGPPSFLSPRRVLIDEGKKCGGDQWIYISQQSLFKGACAAHSLLLRTIALAKRRQKNPNEAARTEWIKRAQKARRAGKAKWISGEHNTHCICNMQVCIRAHTSESAMPESVQCAALVSS